MPPESLSCKECRTTYPLEARYVCEQCFGPLEVNYAPRTDADPDALRRRIQAGPHSLWRYSDFLPVSAPPKGTLAAGWTPLLRVDRLAEALGLEEVWIKNDAANPTHSFKDRVVSVAMARARELGFQTIACASTGNLANAVAAHAAAAGLESFVFVPADLEEQKVLATGVYGTNLVSVKGTYDDVNRLCTELSAEHEWAFVNINLRPYYSQGSKTLAFETAEQLGWTMPDAIVYPTGVRPATPIVNTLPTTTTLAESPTLIANETGFPDLIVPAGMTKDGLPVTISFFGPAFSEGKLISYGYDFEQATHARRLPVHTPALAGDTITIP